MTNLTIQDTTWQLYLWRGGGGVSLAVTWCKAGPSLKTVTKGQCEDDQESHQGDQEHDSMARVTISLSTITSTNRHRQAVSLFSDFLTNWLENLSDKNNWWALSEWRNTKIISGHYEWFVARCSIYDKNFDQMMFHSNVEVSSIDKFNDLFQRVTKLWLLPLICSWIEDRGWSPQLNSIQSVPPLAL